MTSYLKYMEQVSLASDDTDPSPTEQTNLQRVYIVEAIDGATGEPWYPDPPEPEVDPIVVDQPAEWVTTGDYRPNQTIQARTATFTGGRPPLKLYSRFQVKRANGDIYYSERFDDHPNTPTLISWTVPTQVSEITFYTVASDTPSPSRDEEDIALSATDPHTVVEELVLRTATRYSPGNLYRINEPFAAYSADFSGGVSPITVTHGFKYKKAGLPTTIFYGTRWFSSPNQVTYRIWSPPADAVEVMFYSDGIDSTGQKVSSPGPWVNITQPSIVAVQQPPNEITDGPIAHRVDFVASGEYYEYYQWQFTDPNGNWHDLSRTAVANYYPRANYATFSGEQSCCFQWKKNSGKHFEFLRCKAFDQIAGIRSNTIISNTVKLLPI